VVPPRGEIDPSQLPGTDLLLWCPARHRRSIQLWCVSSTRAILSVPSERQATGNRQRTRLADPRCASGDSITWSWCAALSSSNVATGLIATIPESCDAHTCRRSPRCRINAPAAGPDDGPICRKDGWAGLDTTATHVDATVSVDSGGSQTLCGRKREAPPPSSSSSHRLPKRCHAPS
jgi:hypothetical protein